MYENWEKKTIFVIFEALEIFFPRLYTFVTMK